MKNTATHLAFVTLLSSQFMSGAVATWVYRSVQFLGKERQCSSAVLWSNDYNSITNKIWKEQVFCNGTKDSLVLGQGCGLTQRSLFIAHAFSEEDELCVSFATGIWTLFLFKGRQITVGSDLKDRLDSSPLPWEGTYFTRHDCSKPHPNWPETFPGREAKVGSSDSGCQILLPMG